MNFKTLSKVLNTSFSNVQNLANVLRDAFSDMESGGSSGTTVSWDQIQETGTKIAEITVDGVKTNVMAPESSNVAYSKTARKIGTWIDGSDVYEQTIEFNSDLTVPYNDWVSSGIMTEDMNIIIDCIGIAADGSYYGSIMAYNDDGDIKLQTLRNGYNVFIKYLVMKYTIVSE